MTKTRPKRNRYGVPMEVVDRLIELRSQNAGWIELKRAYPGRWPESVIIDTFRFSDGWNDISNKLRIHASACKPEDFMWCIACKLETTWVNPTVVGLLARIPDDLSVLPVLADALEESGCFDETILEVLRDH